MQAMLDEVAPKLKSDVRMLSETVRADAREGDIGMQLGEIATANPDVAIGSYPFFDPQHGPTRMWYCAPVMYKSSRRPNARLRTCWRECDEHNRIAPEPPRRSVPISTAIEDDQPSFNFPSRPARHTCFCGALRSAKNSLKSTALRRRDLDDNSCSHDESGEQVFGLEQAPRLEQVGDEHSERVQDCKY